MKRDDKIFVAGGKGMVGSAIIRKLKSLGYTNIISSFFRTKPDDKSVVWEKVDLRRQDEVEKLFEKHCPDYVFLAAAKVGGILANNTYKAEFIYDNLMIAANVIDSSYKFDVKKLLNLGSSCIYPKYAPQPMKEEYLLTGELEPTNEPYAIAKIAAIKLCRYYNEQYGTNFISVMPTNLYGPGDNYHLLNSHVLPALIRKFYLGKLMRNGEYDKVMDNVYKWEGIKEKNEILSFLEKQGISANKIRIWGTGKVMREFLFVDDLADAVVFLMDNYHFRNIGEFVNIGTGKDIAIKELAGIVKEIVGYDGDIFFDSSMPDGTPKKLLDVSSMEKLGWSAETGLKRGISLVVEGLDFV